MENRTIDLEALFCIFFRSFVFADAKYEEKNKCSHRKREANRKRIRAVERSLKRNNKKDGTRTHYDWEWNGSHKSCWWMPPPPPACFSFLNLSHKQFRAFIHSVDVLTGKIICPRCQPSLYFFPLSFCPSHSLCAFEVQCLPFAASSGRWLFDSQLLWMKSN